MKHVTAIAIILLFFASTCALADDHVFRISTPFKTLFSTPEQTGMLDQIVREAFRRIGLKSKIVFSPTERSLVAVNEGLFDAEMNRIAGIDKLYPNLIQVPEPNMVMRFVAFATRDFPISGWESLKPLRVGLVKGWKILEHNTKDFTHVTQVMTADQLFLMLKRRRIDVALFSEILGYEWVRKLKCKEVHHLEPPLASRNMYLYLYKKHKDLAIPLAQALREMKRDGTYDRIVKETTGYLYEPLE